MQAQCRFNIARLVLGASQVSPFPACGELTPNLLTEV